MALVDCFGRKEITIAILRDGVTINLYNVPKSCSIPYINLGVSLDVRSTLNILRYPHFPRNRFPLTTQILPVPSAWHTIYVS